MKNWKLMLFAGAIVAGASASKAGALDWASQDPVSQIGAELADRPKIGEVVAEPVSMDASANADEFVLESQSPELIKAVAALLAAETGMTVVATKITHNALEREVIEANPASSTNNGKNEKFQWLGFSGHIEGGTHIADGGAGITLFNNLVRVAGDVGIPSYGYSITVSPLAPILRGLKIQPTFTRKYFVKGDLSGEETRDTTTKANLLYGVSVTPFQSKKVGFYAQAGKGTVTTEKWLHATDPDGSRSIGVTTQKQVIVIVGTSIGF